MTITLVEYAANTKKGEELLKRKNIHRLFSTIMAFAMVFTMLAPMNASANTAAKPFKQNGTSESTMQLKAAIAEQLNVLEGESTLHKDLQSLSGDEEVAVIVHLSEKPVALEQGIQELAGRTFTSSDADTAKAKVNAQQTFIKKEMNANKISFTEGFTYTNVLNGFSATVKAADLQKLLAIKGVTLIEPDAEVYAFEDPSASTDGQVDAAMNTSISFLGIEKLWAEGIKGKGIKVAVLDTGIDKDHPEFAGIYKGGKNFIPNSSAYTRNRADNDASETSPVERPAGTPEFDSRGSAFYTSHGTHVAGTIAAIGANPYNVKGIAPEVDLYAYRVLGAYGSGSNSGVVKAIDTAVIDKMDVINLSLGGGANTETDAGSFAINNAMMAGTISVIATGNSGPNRGTMGTPSTARLGIAVGNTTNPEGMFDSTVNVTVGSYKLTKTIKLMGSTFGKDLATQLPGQYDVVAVPKNGEKADYNGLDVKGKVALVSRGGIAFVDKIEAARAAGAVATLIHNFAGGTNAPNASGTFLGDAFEFIPSYDLSQTDGDAIRAALAKGPGTVTFANFNKTMTTGDEVNDSSSRGPSTPNFDIKPDVSAPGTNIMSTIPMYKADFPDASYVEAFTRMTGTSMATPHIAGIAALVKQANPSWTAFDVKVALSNSAKILNTTKYDVMAQGAGRVQAYEAARPTILAYAKDVAVLNASGAIVENLKGTVTFGPQSLKEKNISVTKDILVKDIKGNGGNYNVTIDVTKAFGDAKVTVDKSSFTLNGEQLLKVTLTASKNTSAPKGSEILGYIKVNGGGTEVSLPFAADFGGGPASALENLAITETDLSFNGDGIKDSAVLSFKLIGNLKTNYIELWDIMNPEGGEYEDGYIGYLHAANSLAAGSYTLNVLGNYYPWEDDSKQVKIPDGLYTIDFTGQTVSGDPPIIGDYVGPIVVKSTAGTIEGTVAGKKVTGKVIDKYVDYQAELAKEEYDLGYDINTKLKATFEVLENNVVKSSGAVKLAQDGSFTFDVGTLSKENSVKVKYIDAAGNKAEKTLEKGEADPVTYEVSTESLTLQIGGTEQLTVTEITTKPDGETEERDITAEATFQSANETIATVNNGKVTAVAAGETTIIVSYEGEEVATVAVTVTAEEVDPVPTISASPDNLSLKVGESHQLKVTLSHPVKVEADTGGAVVVPETGEAVPETGEAVPETGEAAPETGEAAPGTGEAAPETGEAAPGMGEAAPGTGEAAPETGEAAPETGEAVAKPDEDVTELATYSVLPEGVVTVSKGKVVAIGEGSTTITITYEGLTTTVSVKVDKVPVVDPPTPEPPGPSTPGGGGGSSTPTPTPKPSVVPGKVVVDDKNVGDQLKDSTLTKVEVTVPAPTEAKPQVNVEVSAKSLAALAESGKPLVLKAGSVELTIPSAVLKDLAKNSTGKVTFSIGIVKGFKVPGNGTVVSDVYEFQITVEKDGKTSTITTFSQPIEITVPVTSSAVVADSKVAAYSINEKMNVLEYLNGKYAKGTATFKTDHFSKFVVVEHNKVFADLKNSRAKEYIESLAAKSLIKGKTDDLFAPDDEITRGQFAVLLARMLNLPKQDFAGTFSDVTAEMNWMATEIEAASRAGIVVGNGGKFEPNEKITRQQMATMIIRVIEYNDASVLEGVTSKISFADDASISKYAKESVGIAAGLGIISGKDENGKKVFAPNENATRAQAAIMLYKLLEIM